ncbi:MAG: VOC family protein [Pseudomonadota bacterium]
MSVEKHDKDVAAASVEALPVLPSLNIHESMEFYRDKLGFEATVYEAHDYLIMRRPGIELHFWLTDRKDFCENTSVYIRGGGIDALHAELSQRDGFTITPMMDREWGMREFYVHDPHGNLLRFGRELPQ